MDARQRELAMLLREGWWRHALVYDEWLDILSKSHPQHADPISKEVRWLESRVRLWYQLLLFSAVQPTLLRVLKPYAEALFSGATFKPPPVPPDASEAQKSHLAATQRKVLAATVAIATRGKTPTIEEIASEMGSDKRTVCKFGTPEEILLGAIAQLVQDL